MWLIFVGVMLIGAALFFHAQNKQGHRQAGSSGAKPITSPATLLSYALGVALCLTSFLLFYFAPHREEKWQSGAFVIFAVILFIFAVNLFKGARSADKKYAEDMKYRADAHASELAFWK